MRILSLLFSVLWASVPWFKNSLSNLILTILSCLNKTKLLIKTFSLRSKLFKILYRINKIIQLKIKTYFKTYYNIIVFLLIILSSLIITNSLAFFFKEITFEIQEMINTSLVLLSNLNKPDSDLESNVGSNSNLIDNLLAIGCEPVKTYKNVSDWKKQILAENRGQAGIYCWLNTLNGKYYIGSAKDLAIRLSKYYNKNFLTSPNQNMIIYKSLLKNGYSNFTLYILKYCEIPRLLEQEQYFLDNLKPEYNILKKAGSSLGFKHSEETLARFKKRVWSPEYKAAFAKSKLGNTNSKFQKISIKLEVFDTFTQSKIVYSSIREAAKAIGCVPSSITKIIQKFQTTGVQKLLKKRYIITQITKDQ